MNEKSISRLLTGITVLVTVAWVISFLAPLVQPEYKPPQEINIVMMAIVGLFVQLTMKAKNPKDGDK